MKKQIIYYGMLIVYGLILVALVWKPGNLFMSTTDYPSQHFSFADYFRKLFYETGDWFPDFANAIGGGQNIYNFSYYGLLRPDVLLSYLLPFVPIYYILTFYSILLYLSGGCLIFKWLKNHDYHVGICLLMSFMFLGSSVLFQSHRQIMFVNYMPFFIISLLGVDKYLKDKKTGMVVAGIFLMIIHSYYFSVSGIVLCSIYYLYRFYNNIYKNAGKSFHSFLFGKDSIFPIFLWIFTAVMATAAFLLPTALSMLENMRGGNGIQLENLIDFNFLCNTLMYDYYGCGFSFFIWFVLCLGLTMKKTRVMSAMCIFSLLLPIVPYLLNGTLYIHKKIYLTFIPIILYLCAKILNLKLKKEPSDEKHLIAVSVIPFVPVLCGMTTKWLFIDAGVTIAILYFARKKQQILFLTILLSTVVCLFLNSRDTLLTNEEYKDFYSTANYENIEENDNYRFTSLAGGIYKVNYVANPVLWQTSVYSSIQSKYYENFIEETMKLSTTSRNNMAHTNAPNIFFHMFMGAKIMHTKSVVPAGYQVTKENTDGSYLLGNNDVLPVAYVSYNLTNEKDFHTLEYPYTLDTLVNTSIVAGAGTSSYQSQITRIPLCDMITEVPNMPEVNFNIAENKLSISAKETVKFNVTLNNETDIVILTGNIKSNNMRDDISIRINKIKEKLSGTTAPYNNKNYFFNYVISSNEAVKTLTFECSPGEYSLNDIAIYVCNYEDINQFHNTITPLQWEDCSGKEILNGSVSTTQDGYFITSIPYQNGMTAIVDGEEVSIENVNCGFAGFQLNAGEHHITLSFHAPGKKAGTVVSIFGILIWIIGFFYKRRKHLKTLNM